MISESPHKRRVVLLGSTGSIGESALRVAKEISHRMKIVGLAAGTNGARLFEQAAEVGCCELCIGDVQKAKSFTGLAPDGCTLRQGPEGLLELATLPEADLVLIAIVGTAGLAPALAAIEAGKDIAVASKEILVMAGEQVMNAAMRRRVQVLPVDSEHNAIFQCLNGRDASSVKRLILTASGGPFRKFSAEELKKVTPAMALRHPTWNMGRKISVDSATLFNKGLEMIEARWLFDIGIERVDVVVHPQSIIHSMVEFFDGSILAQMSHSDMAFPIQYAVTWPERISNSLPALDFALLARLDFEKPRREVFPALDLATHAGTTGGTLPAVLNAANEIAVAAFLSNQLSFPGIWHVVEEVINDHQTIFHPCLDEIIDADRWARRRAAERVSQKSAHQASV